MRTSAQLRAARAMLRLEQADLASTAGVSVETIKRLEAMPDVLRGNSATLDNVQSALEMLGIQFLEDDIVGLRLRENRNEAFIAEIVRHAGDMLTVALHVEFGSESPAIAAGREQAIDRAIETVNSHLRKRLEGMIPGNSSNRSRSRAKKRGE